MKNNKDVILKKEAKIKSFWDEQAEKYTRQVETTTPDLIYKELEIRNIMKYIPQYASILDVGCGNGISTLGFAQLKGVRVHGVDYSEKMIWYAKENLESKPNLKKRVKFDVANVLDLQKCIPEKYDVIVTERCLINLSSFEKQKNAIKQLHSVLKQGGLLIMCENTIQGMEKMNGLRKSVDLYEIPIRWHNLYFNEDELHPFLETFFDIENIDPFASTYYIASRIFNAKLTKEGEEPSFDSQINRLSLKLPNIGDFCPVRIYVLRKK